MILFVPSIGLDVSLLERLAASIDYPIATKVILNNGPEDALEKFGDTHRDWKVFEPATGNLGVAGSWNWAAKMFPNESILIMNEDAWFLPGQLGKIVTCADDNPTAPVIHINDTNAYYCFVWTKAGRERFGLFDENLWPAYLEDTDYRLRMRLEGVSTWPYALQGEEPVPHGKTRTGGVNYAAMIQGCGLLNRAYWQRKWGNQDYENPLYKTPYKDHRLSLKEWVWMPEERAKRQPLWQAFMEQNPSIYA